MSTTHLKKSVIEGGNINTIKALKRYWNSPVSDIDDNSTEAKYTLLQMALLLNKRKIVEYMIPQKDLDLTTKATDGTTALMLAVEKEVPLDWVRAMLERGAAENIDAKDNEGRSALDRCQKGSPMYDLLVQHGATPPPPTPPPPTPPPEPPAEPEKPQADTPAEDDASRETVATEVDAVSQPFDPDIPPGLEEHPGFWATMCSCGGRQGKRTIETVELPPGPAGPRGVPKAKAPLKAPPGAKASLDAVAKAKAKAPFGGPKAKPPAPKAGPKELPHPKAAPEPPPPAQPQAAAA